MAAGSEEVPVVPTEAAEGKEGEVSVVVVEKKGEGVMVSEAEKKGEGAVVLEVEKKREGDMVSEVVSVAEKKGEGAVVSEVEKKGEGDMVSGAAEKVVSEALEDVVSEALEKAVSEALEKAVLDVAGKVVSEAVEKKGEESVEKAAAVEAGKREEEESGRMITLESNDGEQIKVTEASARLSELLREMIDSSSADNVIQLPKVNSKTLNKVIEYCNKHAYYAANKSGTYKEKDWDKTFINELEKDKGDLFVVIMAANFLNIQELLVLTCQSVADTIKGKEIRKAFNIKDNLTEQEKEEIRKENDSAFE